MGSDLRLSGLTQTVGFMAVTECFHKHKSKFQDKKNLPEAKNYDTITNCER